MNSFLVLGARCWEIVYLIYCTFTRRPTSFLALIRAPASFFMVYMLLAVDLGHKYNQKLTRLIKFLSLMAFLELTAGLF
jgi:hypothetical protein